MNMKSFKECEQILVHEIKKLPERSTNERRRRELYDALNSIRRSAQILDRTYKVTRQKLEHRSSNMPGKTEEIHESYGVISLTKPTGRMRLVGSMSDYLPTCMEIKISRARRTIDPELFTEHFYHDGGPILRIRISQYQWAELISNPMGAEIPCTLDNVMGVNMDEVPEEVRTPMEQIAHDAKKESREHVDESETRFHGKIDHLQEIIEKAKISKKAQSEFLTALKDIRTMVSAPKITAEWASRRVAESIEETTAQARIEMGAAFESLVRRAGLTSIKKELQQAITMQLEEDTKKD